MREALGGRVEFRRVPWIGLNSHWARHKGAMSLRRSLTKSIADRPQALHVVVAHSHGGNVAVTALDAESGLGQRVGGVVCMATPFLGITLRANALPVLAPLLAFVAAIGGMAATDLLVGAAPLSPMDTAENPLRVFFSPAWWATGVLGGGVYFAVDWSCRLLAQLMSRAHNPGHDRERLLIVRAAGDEASALLGFGHLVRWLARKLNMPWALLNGVLRFFEQRPRTLRYVLWYVLLPWLVASVALYALTPFSFVGVFEHLLRSPPPADHWGWLQRWLEAEKELLDVNGWWLYTLYRVLDIPTKILVSLLLIAAASGRLSTAVQCVGSLAFGWEAALLWPLLEVSAETTPEGSWQIHQFPMGTSGAWSHSVYENPAAVTLIVEWVAELRNRR